MIGEVTSRMRTGRLDLYSYSIIDVSKEELSVEGFSFEMLDASRCIDGCCLSFHLGLFTATEIACLQIPRHAW